MNQRHIVIDQNAFRQEKLLRPAMHRAKIDGDYIVVTDMALAEMMKSQQWESTTKRSLQILSEDPALVVCSKAIGPLMKEEFDSGEPASSIWDEEVSEKVRHLLGEVRNGDGATLEHVRKVIQDARELGQRQHFDHTRNKAQLTQLVRSWKEDLSADDIRAVRRGDEERIRELLSNEEMQVTCINALVGAGYERSLAIRLTMDPSVTSHEFLTFVAIGLRWLDGIEGADEKKITNDLADKDYIVTATFCRDLVSEEIRVRDQFARMSDVIERRAKLFEAIVERSEGRA